VPSAKLSRHNDVAKAMRRELAGNSQNPIPGVLTMLVNKFLLDAFLILVWIGIKYSGVQTGVYKMKQIVLSAFTACAMLGATILGIPATAEAQTVIIIQGNQPYYPQPYPYSYQHDVVYGYPGYYDAGYGDFGGYYGGGYGGYYGAGYGGGYGGYYGGGSYPAYGYGYRRPHLVGYGYGYRRPYRRW
jgi:hypothetical protein